MEAVYELIRILPPFKGYKLPPADDIEFRVFDRDHTRDWAVYEAFPRRISVNNAKHGQLNPLIGSIMHECLHLHQCLNRGGEVGHDEWFNRTAKRICRLYGYDTKTF